jgi:hypothetical protein
VRFAAPDETVLTAFAGEKLLKQFVRECGVCHSAEAGFVFSAEGAKS